MKRRMVMKESPKRWRWMCVERQPYHRPPPGPAYAKFKIVRVDVAFEPVPELMVDMRPQIDPLTWPPKQPVTDPVFFVVRLPVGAYLPSFTCPAPEDDE